MIIPLLIVSSGTFHLESLPFSKIHLFQEGIKPKEKSISVKRRMLKEMMGNG
jgi:hypothetical protein